MGDKDINELFGNPELLIGCSLSDMKPLPIVENSIELDSLSVREKMEVEPLQIKPLSFEVEASFSDDIAKFLGVDLASEPSRISLMIQEPPIINKPRNLKYPNKKRARRVWKKWAKRYGTSPGKMIYLPNVEVESEYNGDYMSVNVTAKPTKQD